MADTPRPRRRRRPPRLGWPCEWEAGCPERTYLTMRVTISVQLQREPYTVDTLLHAFAHLCPQHSGEINKRLHRGWDEARPVWSVRTE